MSAASQIPSKTLAVRGLTKRMGERVLWSGLNLEFLPGQMTALTGQSGCGKTTLLNVLGLLERPTGGVVTYGARDLTDGSPRTRRLMHRNVMGFMFQNYALVEQWTVARNLQLALRCVGAAASERRRLIRRALHVVHLDGYDKRLVYTLSGASPSRGSSSVRRASCWPTSRPRHWTRTTGPWSCITYDASPTTGQS